MNMIHAEFPMFSKQMMCGLKATRGSRLQYGWLLKGKHNVTCTRCLNSAIAKKLAALDNDERNPGC